MPPSTTPGHAEAQAIRDLAASVDRVAEQVGKAAIGQKAIVGPLLTALLARGHCLLVGVPGLGQTQLAGGLARVLQLSFSRIACHSDLSPAHVIGAEAIPDELDGRRRAVLQPGPLFANIVLAEDFHRAPPKTQAIVLDAMQDGQIAAGGQTYRLPEPFVVLATHNPMEQDGTDPLPAAHLDSFLFSLRLDYPSRADEIQMMKAATGPAKAEVTAVLDGKQVARLQEIVRQVVVADHVFGYAADLVRATRPTESQAPKFVPELLAWGAGPKASQSLIQAAKARAVLHGRVHVTTDDVRAVALPVLRHRVTPTFHADAEGVTPDAVIERLLAALPAGENGAAKPRKS